MNLAKGGKSAETVLSRRQKEKLSWRTLEQAWSLRTMLAGQIHAENPEGSNDWEICIGPAYEVKFHMCAVGMVCKDSSLLC